MATGTGKPGHECWVTAGQEGGARWGESRVRAWCEGAAGCRIPADSAPLPHRSTAYAQVSGSEPSGRAARDPGWREVEDTGGAMWGVAGSGAGTGPQERRRTGWRLSERPGRAAPRQRGGAWWGPSARSTERRRQRRRSRERRSPGSRSRGFGDSGAGRGAPQNGAEQRGDRGREPNGQRRGSSPARFSQRSSILRMKLPPSPVPGAVGPRPPPGPPPEPPVPEEVPLGPVMA